MWCSTSSTAQPSVARRGSRRISSASSAMSSAPRPPAGSSSSSSRGRAASARASATRLRTRVGQGRRARPRRARRRPARRGWPGPSPRSRRSSRSLAGSPSSAGTKPARAVCEAPAITFSSTVSPAKSPTPCRVRAMPSRVSRCGRGRSGRPSRVSGPVVRRDEAADHVEQRGLAGAVGPDDADHLARVAPAGRRRRGRPGRRNGRRCGAVRGRAPSPIPLSWRVFIYTRSVRFSGMASRPSMRPRARGRGGRQQRPPR